MVTRSQLRVVKPISHLSLHTSSISPLPKNTSDALKDPQWRDAMYHEYNVLVKIALGCLYQGPQARLVANGSSQQLGVDFDETFSSVVKPATICMVLSLAVSRKWPIDQLYVKNAFLNSDLSETVYMHQPPGFIDARFPNHGSQVAYLLLYVDDINLTASSTAPLQHLIGSLHHEFDMTDLGALIYFLGIFVVRHSTGLFLSQCKYALQLLERAYMVNCNPSRTPVDTDSKLHTLSRSSAEAKYRGVANVVAQTPWLRNLLCELHSPLSTATLVYCDNYVDIFTKGLPFALFEDFRSSLSVRPPPAPTVGAY
ncbi:ribonuclease H-like domain-containing protein [Tanacetum coccineum]